MNDQPQFRKSTYCGQNGCVEIDVDGGEVRLRDSKRPSDVLAFDEHEWVAFVAGVKNGEFDL